MFFIQVHDFVLCKLGLEAVIGQQSSRAQASSIRAGHHFGPKLGPPSVQQGRTKSNLGYLGRAQA